jgi:hypothetical protein
MSGQCARCDAPVTKFLLGCGIAPPRRLGVSPSPNTVSRCILRSGGNRASSVIRGTEQQPGHPACMATSLNAIASVVALDRGAPDRRDRGRHTWQQGGDPGCWEQLAHRQVAIRLAGDTVPFGRSMIAAGRCPFGRRDGGDAWCRRDGGQQRPRVPRQSLMVYPDGRGGMGRPAERPHPQGMVKTWEGGPWPDWASRRVNRTSG